MRINEINNRFFINSHISPLTKMIENAVISFYTTIQNSIIKFKCGKSLLLFCGTEIFYSKH